MPQQTTISVPANTWTQLTDANVTTITFQNVGGDFVRIRATNGTTGGFGGIAFIVPNNHYYRVNGAASLKNWAELR